MRISSKLGMSKSQRNGRRSQREFERAVAGGDYRLRAELLAARDRQFVR